MRLVGFTFLLALVLKGAEPPGVMLWAWEHPADLRSLPPRAGVAFLASTILLTADQAKVRPRFQPLKLSPGTFRMAVVRIECDTSARPSLSVEQRDATSRAIVDTVRIVKAGALQIDFDARVSERQFYADLIREVRRLLGAKTFLSVTALVSWCGEESTWIDALPVDEWVPMTFEMGKGAIAIESRLREGISFRNKRCAASIGIASSDLQYRRGQYNRVYLFPYDDWSTESVNAVLEHFR